jgi:hypothetical protein
MGETQPPVAHYYATTNDSGFYADMNVEWSLQDTAAAGTPMLIPEASNKMLIRISTARDNHSPSADT